MSFVSRLVRGFHRLPTLTTPSSPALFEPLEERTLMAIITDPAQGALQMRMTVDFATGAATLSNTTGSEIRVDGYQIVSTAADLSPTGWISIHDATVAGSAAVQAALGAQALDFSEYNASASTITEATLEGYAAFAGSSSWTIGKPVLPESALAGDLKWYFITTTTPGGNMLLGDLVILPGATTTVTVDALTTADTRPALSGTVSNPNAAISVTVGGHTYNSAVNHGDGTWTLADNAIPASLGSGVFDVVVTASVDGHPVASDATTNELTVVAAPSAVSIVKTKDGKETLGTTTGMARFTVSRAGGDMSGPLVVHYAANAGSAAVSGDDYAALPGSVTIPAGKPSATIDVQVLDDNLVEPAESLTLDLTGKPWYLLAAAKTSATASLADNEPTVSILKTKDGKETLGSTAGMARFTVARTGGSNTAALVVTYNVNAASTATAGSDYTNLPGTVTIPAGKANVTIDVAVTDDALAESTEILTLDLPTQTSYRLAPGKTSATVSLADNEPTVSILKTKDGKETLGATTGMARFTVARTGGSNVNPLVVTYNVDPGSTATDGLDYTTLPGTVTIPAGKANVTVDVAVTDDALVDPAETLTLTLPVDTGYRLAAGKTSATVSIADNEPTVSIVKTRNGSETNGSTTGMGRFTVTRTGGTTTADLVVHYSVNVASTATAGDDYTTLSGSVTILAGQTSAVIDVPVLADLVADPSETLTLDLTAEPWYTISPAKPSATLTITGA